MSLKLVENREYELEKINKEKWIDEQATRDDIADQLDEKNEILEIIAQYGVEIGKKKIEEILDILTKDSSLILDTLERGKQISWLLENKLYLVNSQIQDIIESLKLELERYNSMSKFKEYISFIFGKWIAEHKLPPTEPAKITCKKDFVDNNINPISLSVFVSYLIKYENKETSKKQDEAFLHWIVNQKRKCCCKNYMNLLNHSFNDTVRMSRLYCNAFLNSERKYRREKRLFKLHLFQLTNYIFQTNEFDAKHDFWKTVKVIKKKQQSKCCIL